MGNVRLFSRGRVMWEAISGLVFQRRTTHPPTQKPANALWVCTRQPDDMLSRVTVVMHTMEDVGTTYLVKSTSHPSKLRFGPRKCASAGQLRLTSDESRHMTLLGIAEGVPSMLHRRCMYQGRYGDRPWRVKRHIPPKNSVKE